MNRQHLGSSVIDDARRAFYAEAGAAIRERLITPAEMLAIARPGTRKAGYWARHLYDLRLVVKERRQHMQITEGAESP